jgi:hypothetical protein
MPCRRLRAHSSLPSYPHPGDNGALPTRFKTEHLVELNDIRVVIAAFVPGAITTHNDLLGHIAYLCLQTRKSSFVLLKNATGGWFSTGAFDTIRRFLVGRRRIALLQVLLEDPSYVGATGLVINRRPFAPHIFFCARCGRWSRSRTTV